MTTQTVQILALPRSLWRGGHGGWRPPAPPRARVRVALENVLTALDANPVFHAAPVAANDHGRGA